MRIFADVRASPALRKKIRELLRRPEYEQAVDKVVSVDPRREPLQYCHRSLRAKSFSYAVRNFSRVNRWKKSKLPVLIWLRGHLILWDGHHRVFAARMLKKKLRCRLIVLTGR